MQLYNVWHGAQWLGQWMARNEKDAIETCLMYDTWAAGGPLSAKPVDA